MSIVAIRQARSFLIRITPRQDRSEEFLDLTMAEIDERKRPSGRAGQVGLEVESQAVEDGRNDVRRFDGAVCRHGADRVARPDNPTSLDAATGESDREALRPVVAPAGG